MLKDGLKRMEPMSSPESSPKLLVAASGTGGHLFPAIATAAQLTDYRIEWLGVPTRLETELVPKTYPLHLIDFEGIQRRGLSTVWVFSKLAKAILTVRQLLKQGGFQGVFTTGGYIAAPAIIAARSLGLPTILHESNALPGKVTRWLSPWCTTVALGFEAASTYLPRANSVCVGTPVREQFLVSQTPLDLDIPDDAPLIAVVGGSQGAVAVNRFVRSAAPTWLKQGAWVVHLTGTNDPDADSLQHPQYISLPFYDNMAGLLHRANLMIGRAGAGTLTELAITSTPSILIPYPYAAEDHQTYNAAVFAATGAAIVCQQSALTTDLLREKVMGLLNSPEHLHKMAQASQKLAIADSAEQLAQCIQTVMDTTVPKQS
jgi:UDP-N-acetylglucosamine--N-acetylmuramyl-(pentapeptide) pyrophosphoryl-undecaprenol N-acetylglucosamine transferase